MRGLIELYLSLICDSRRLKLALELVNRKRPVFYRKRARILLVIPPSVMMMTVVMRQLYPHTAFSKVCIQLVPGNTWFSTSAGADRQAFNSLTQETLR